MLHPILHRKLTEIVEARRMVRLRWANIVLVVLLVIALIVAVLDGRLVHDRFYAFQLAVAVFAVIGGIAARIWARCGSFDVHQLARDIESRHPELQALLLTAVEQKPGTDGYGYLQERVIDETVARAARQMWADELTGRSMQRAAAVRGLALLLLAGSYGWFVWNHIEGGRNQRAPAAAGTPKQPDARPAFEVTVTPGDAEVEKGSRLIVEARFAADVPPDAVIVVTDPEKGEAARIPMRATVDQQVFGGLIARIDRDSLYRVEFAGGRSRDYQISTFIHPELERSDVRITPPAYAAQPVKEIRNTLKVSALEGSELAFRFKVNKPVAAAELYGEDKSIISLKPSAADSTVLEAAMKPEKSQKYRLHLVDDRERSNKQPPWLSVTLQTNQLPKIEVAFPKRDIQVSSIQELPVEAKVWDDLGVRKTGAVFNIAGTMREVILHNQPMEPAKKHDLKAVLDLEGESVEPRQLVSYYFFADDQGPGGEVRRAMSDMFFAEVRHFEDIFRESEPPPGAGMQGQRKGQADQLVNLQKQVVNATWRLIRDTNAGRRMDDAAGDVGVVKQSQEIAMAQVKEAMEKAEDAEIKTSLTEAWKSMKDAITPLDQAAVEKKRGPLNQALAFEQTALEWLYRTQSREHRVMRQNSKSQGAGEQANQRQLMSLELKQKDQRYEEEKQAGQEQSAEQQENLQVLNRLKELARRQEALAEKMKELEKQIEQAKTEEERQELANQLKRLQQEQEDLLRDLDELQERMGSSQNQATMAEARRQLENTRDQVLDAAEKLKEQQVAQAANAATRAQRQLEEMQEDFRKKTSRRFSDEMRQMKQRARDVADQQKKIADSLEDRKTSDVPGDVSNSLERMLDGAQTARQIDEQRERIEQLMDEMRRVSEQAEVSEPRLSQALYDAVRKAHTSGVGENLEETRDYARVGERSRAQEAERKVTKAVDELHKGVEKAAESILGGETEALRMARAELDSLIKEMKDSEAPDPQRRAQEGGQEKPAPNGRQGQMPGGGQPEQEQAERDGKPGGAPRATREGSELAAADQPGRPSSEQRPGAADASAGKQEEAARQTAENSKGSGPGKDAGEKGQPHPSEPGQQASRADPGRQPGTAPGQGPQTASSQQGAPNQGQTGAETTAQGQRGSSGTGPSRDQPSGSSPGMGGQHTELATSDAPDDRGGTRNREGGLRRNLGADVRRGSDLRGGGGGGDNGMFFDAPGQIEDASPLTGSGFDRWVDRLRGVEESLSQPELRNEAARVMDNARAMRTEYRRNNMAPQAGSIVARITQPLAELRDRVTEELAKRDAGNSLAPVDRDPVPQPYRDLVRRYYSELGAGK